MYSDKNMHQLIDNAIRKQDAIGLIDRGKGVRALSLAQL